MPIFIESIPMQQHLSRAVDFRLAAMHFKLTFAGLFPGIITDNIYEHINKMIPLAATLKYTVDQRIAYATESTEDAGMLIDSLEMLIRYDQMDLTANRMAYDRIHIEDLDTRIKNCMLLKRNIESTL